MQIEDITAGEHYVIYTDGSCRPNPGAGGWGAALYRMNGEEQMKEPLELSGSKAKSTNNEMELTAAIRALSCLSANGVPAIVYTDSQYVIGCMTEWLPGWVARGWWKKDGTPVVNADLIKQLLSAVGDRRVHWEWVKGHSGREGNERADHLATTAREHAKQQAASSKNH